MQSLLEADEAGRVVCGSRNREEPLRAECLNQASDCTLPVMEGSTTSTVSPVYLQTIRRVFFLYVAPDWKSQLQIDPKRQKCLLRSEHGLPMV